MDTNGDQKLFLPTVFKISLKFKETHMALTTLSVSHSQTRKSYPVTMAQKLVLPIYGQQNRPFVITYITGALV